MTESFCFELAAKPSGLTRSICRDRHNRQPYQAVPPQPHEISTRLSTVERRARPPWRPASPATRPDAAAHLGDLAPCSTHPGPGARRSPAA
jgi:hypothetical protein